MKRRAAKDALTVAAELNHHEFRPDRAGRALRRLNRHVGDHAARARARLLRVHAWARQPPHTRLQQPTVVVDQRYGFVRVRLIGLTRYPVPSVRGEQGEPIVEPRFIEEPRFMKEELLADPEVKQLARGLGFAE